MTENPFEHHSPIQLARPPGAMETRLASEDWRLIDAAAEAHRMTQQRRTSFIDLLAEQPSAVMAWEDIRRDPAWQGRWVALDECAYDAAGEATAGLVVDYDDNLADLCARLSEERRQRCSVVFCRPLAESAA